MLSNLLNNNQENGNVGEYISRIGEKTSAMFSKFNKTTLSKMISGSKLTKAFDILKNATNNKLKLKKTKSDPHHTNLGPGPILPLRVGDSEANILAKIYRFMMKVRDEENKKDELRRDFELEMREEENRRHKKLISILGKSKKPEKEKKENPFMNILNKILGGFKDIIGKFTLFKGLGVLINNNVLKILRGFLFRFLPRIMMSVLSKIPGPIGATFAAAGLAYAGINFLDSARETKLKEDRDLNRPNLTNLSDLYTLKGPANHEDVKIPLTDNERIRLMEIYDKLDTETDANKITALHDQEDGIFETALNRKRDSRIPLTEKEESELHSIDIQRGARAIRSSGSNLYNSVTQAIGESLGITDQNEGVNAELRNFFSTQQQTLNNTTNQINPLLAAPQQISNPSNNPSQLTPPNQTEQQSNQQSQPISVNNVTNTGSSTTQDQRPNSVRSWDESFWRAQGIPQSYLDASRYYYR